LPLARHGEAVYRADPAHWLGLLTNLIELAAAGSRKAGRPLVTTEAWSVVDYKDWPGLEWGWVKEGCEVGLRAALATGRWAALCTSNWANLQSCSTGAGTGAWAPVANSTIGATDVTAGPPGQIHFYTNDRFVRLHQCVGANTTMTIVAGIMVEQRAS
jgi:hypothetical protein